MFKSFQNQTLYSSTKRYWETNPQHIVSPHAVESWKATFEEFGILYVSSGQDDIQITPGGQQLAAAVDAKNEEEFAWVGINLLLRYPLRGNGRHSRGQEFEQSDLLLYWFLLAALLELDGLWQAELNRVLCKVFSQTKAQPAIDLIQQLRAGTEDINNHSDPVGQSGGVYNALNQVMVHGSLNHMLFTKVKSTSPYSKSKGENYWQLNNTYKDIVKLALNDQGPALTQGCAISVPLIQRMPAAPPHFDDEQTYFNYLGATVTPLSTAQQQAQTLSAPAIQYRNETVYLLTVDVHFTRISDRCIEGSVQVLCMLAKDQRVILSDETNFTYIVEGKTLGKGSVLVDLRQARPILDTSSIQTLF